MSFLLRNIRSTQQIKAITQHFTRALSITNYATPPKPSIVYPIKLKDNSWIYKQNDEIITPINNNKAIKLPNGLFWVPLIEKENPKVIEDPSVNNSENNEKQAARLIVIRRKKMKKHKLKKLRKRMKYERAKIRQRRELKKEKEFQAVLIQQCKVGEAFSAEDYVDAKLKEYRTAMEYKLSKMPAVKTIKYETRLK